MSVGAVAVSMLCVCVLSQEPGWCRALTVELLGVIRDGTVCRRSVRLRPAERFLFIVTGRTLWSHGQTSAGSCPLHNYEAGSTVACCPQHCQGHVSKASGDSIVAAPGIVVMGHSVSCFSGPTIVYVTWMLLTQKTQTKQNGTRMSHLTGLK